MERSAASGSAGVVVVKTFDFLALNATAMELFGPQSQPFGGLPACSLNVSGGLHAGAAPPPANVFGELPPTLPQETKAWTKLLWNFPAFFGCWNAHCACALAEKPTTNAAAARPPTSCLIMGTLLRTGGWGWRSGRTLVRSTTHRRDVRLIIIGFSFSAQLPRTAAPDRAHAKTVEVSTKKRD